MTDEPDDTTNGPLDMSDEPDDPVLDAMIEAEVARALGPATATMPAEVVDELRCLLRIGLRHHPGARAMLEQLRPTPSVERSDKVATAAFKNRKQVRSGGAS